MVCMDFIKIYKENLPIPKDFTIDNLKNLNIIVGKNNVGKTRFFEAVAKQFKADEELEVVYIKANEVDPTDDHFKTTAASSSLFVTLAAVLNSKIEIHEKENLKKDLQRFFRNTSENFKRLTNDSLKLEVEVSDTDIKKDILKSFITSITTDKKDENDKLIKLDKIGQGYQRLIIASLLQTYAENNNKSKKNLLFLFEEPELFLHPELKRQLNKALKKIAKKDNHQVIVTTHDPYFLWSNMGDDETAAFSFNKNNDMTEIVYNNVCFGVEDEMLHIHLFSKVLSLLKTKGYSTDLGKGMEETSEDLKNLLNGENLVKKDYYYNSEKYKVILPIYIRNKIYHPENDQNGDYTAEELEDSIYILNKILLELKVVTKTPST